LKSFDLIIRNGCLCDGTGNPSRHADVGIVGDRIEAIGRLSDATAKETVDASGKVVAPGFIDMHNHVDHAVLAFPDEESYIMQGVTTPSWALRPLVAPVSDYPQVEFASNSSRSSTRSSTRVGNGPR
jgi:cytosine/adenosine deaminase-related metal-dependent hydrolase